MTLKDKALLVCEHLAGVAETGIQTNAELTEILEQIYRYLHIASNPSCLQTHKAWIQELETEYENMKLAKIL